MKNLKIQSKSGQCGIYNLANLIRDEKIIELYADDEKYTPCGNFEINRILENEGYDFKVEPLISGVNWDSEIPEDYLVEQMLEMVDLANEHNPDNVVPFILQVQAGNNKFGLHAITVLSHNNKWALSDPRVDKYDLIKSPYEIGFRYNYIQTCSVLINPKDGNRSALKTSFFENLEIFE